MFKILADSRGLEDDPSLVWPRSAFLPAKQKVSVTLYLTFDYTSSFTRADRNEMSKLSKFMGRRLSELGGFVILDPVKRYKIILPSGWQNWDKQPHMR